MSNENRRVIAHYQSDKIGVDVYTEEPENGLPERFKVFADATANGKTFTASRTFDRDATEDAHKEDAERLVVSIFGKAKVMPESEGQAEEMVHSAVTAIVINIKRYIAEMNYAPPEDDGFQRFDVAFRVGEHTINPAEVLSVLTRYVNEKHPRTQNLVRVTRAILEAK